jgi:hypothetical protein
MPCCTVDINKQRQFNQWSDGHKTGMKITATAHTYPDGFRNVLSTFTGDPILRKIERCQHPLVTYRDISHNRDEEIMVCLHLMGSVLQL